MVKSNVYIFLIICGVTFSSITQAFSIEIFENTPLTNFSCNSALEITIGNYEDTGPSEGNGASNICFGSGATHASWYVLSLEFDGDVVISSCGGGADTRISVYEGDCENLECVANNDDDCSFEPDGSGFSFASNISFLKNFGTNYYLEWDDRWSTSSFSFEVWNLPEAVDCDGIPDWLDNCPMDCNPDQADQDGDGVGDVCDADIDGDGDPNDSDCDPFDPTIFAGSQCDDGDPETENDVVQEDCICIGTQTPIIIYSNHLLKITLYPNPNIGYRMTLELDQLAENTSAIEMTISDIFGKKIQIEKWNTQDSFLKAEVIFDQKLASGMYLVTIRSGEDISTQKLIVE